MTEWSSEIGGALAESLCKMRKELGFSFPQSRFVHLDRMYTWDKVIQNYFLYAHASKFRV